MSSDSTHAVRREVQAGIAWLTIDRPAAMNALSGVVLAELGAHISMLGRDPEIRVIVITGAGDKAFCAGADLKERRGMSESETRVRIELINRVFTDLARCPRPTVACINGVAFGGGLELALACDFRIAASNAQLGLTEVRLGIMPGAGGTQRLARLIGVARAKELVLLGRRIDATHAHTIGLVTECVPGEHLQAQVHHLCNELAQAAPVSLGQAKAAIDRGFDVGIDEGLRIERQCYDVTLTTEDRNEGLRAFAEKRAPRFQGK
jgi:enoyl-CoA hydratase/carnithine racemase